MDRLGKIGLLVSGLGTIFNLTTLITGWINNLEAWHIIIIAINFSVCFGIFIYLLLIIINDK